MEDGPADDRSPQNGQGIGDNGIWGRCASQTMGIVDNSVADDRPEGNRTMDGRTAKKGAAHDDRS